MNCLLNVDKVDPNPTVHDMKAEKSPLWIACKHNNLEIVRLLITNEFHPADPNIPNKDGKNPLVEAVSQQKIDLVTHLMEESQVEVNRNWMWDDFSLLPWAVYHKSLPLVEMLLKAGANPNIPDNVSQLPICLTVYDERPNSQIVQLLLQYGADMKPCCDQLFTDAIWRDNSGKLELLLEHADNKDLLSGCDLDFMNSAILDDAVACVLVLLHWGFFTEESVFSAISMGNIPIMKMLVEVKPQCLQESWTYPNFVLPAELMEARKHPAPLDMLCRTKIIQQVGFKPTPKVEKLPLPRILKDFVLFKNSKYMVPLSSSAIPVTR